MATLTSTLFGKIISVFFLSMVPVIELRGALPLGIGLGLNPWLVFVVCVLGNTVPIPFIIIFIRRFLNWLRKFSRFERFVLWLEAKATKQGDKLVKYEMLGLFIIVALPLPGTGAWTGSLVAALFDLRLKNAFPVIMAGVATAGLIVLFITYGFTLIL